MRKILIFMALLLFVALIESKSQYTCWDKMVLDGSEPVEGLGVDTTGHWWVVTRPFSNQVRITIDGKQSDVYQSISELTFSPDGSRWAYFALDNNKWNLITNDTIIPIYSQEVGNIGFSPNSKVMYYSTKIGTEQVYYFGSKTVQSVYSVGKLMLSYGGERFALMGYRGSKLILTINGKETDSYDNILPIGFWHDGSFLYAAQNGPVWNVFKNDKELTETYYEIKEVRINNEGTVAAFLARRTLNESVAVMISDEYIEPIVGKPFDAVMDLNLHPTIPLISYKAVLNGNFRIVLSNTEYMGGTQATGSPRFTHDGSSVYFIGCDIDCFINLDGRRYNTNAKLDPNYYYAMKPGSMTTAFATSTTIVVRNISTNQVTTGKMVDQLIPPVYNWRTDEYVTLGIINNKVYLMKCKV